MTGCRDSSRKARTRGTSRSEEHTSELQSQSNLVCRLLLDPPPTEIYTLSLHDALPISSRPRFPIELYWFGTDLTVTRASADHRELIGSRLLAIGDHPVAEVHDRLQGLIPQGENAWYVQIGRAHV